MNFYDLLYNSSNNNNNNNNNNNFDMATMRYFFTRDSRIIIRNTIFPQYWRNQKHSVRGFPALQGNVNFKDVQQVIGSRGSGQGLKHIPIEVWVCLESIPAGGVYVVASIVPTTACNTVIGEICPSYDVLKASASTSGCVVERASYVTDPIEIWEGKQQNGMNEKKDKNNGNGYEFIPEELFVAVNKLGESIKKVDRKMFSVQICPRTWQCSGNLMQLAWPGSSSGSSFETATSKSSSASKNSQPRTISPNSSTSNSNNNGINNSNNNSNSNSNNNSTSNSSNDSKDNNSSQDSNKNSNNRNNRNGKKSTKTKIPYKPPTFSLRINAWVFSIHGPGVCVADIRSTPFVMSSTRQLRRSIATKNGISTTVSSKKKDTRKRGDSDTTKVGYDAATKKKKKKQKT